MFYTKEFLHKHWGSGKKITIDGEKYRVGRMSYGQFFFEPGEEGRETDPFNRGTKWLLPRGGKPWSYRIID
jgi:hypothetical protein